MININNKVIQGIFKTTEVFVEIYNDEESKINRLALAVFSYFFIFEQFDKFTGPYNTFTVQNEFGSTGYLNLNKAWKKYKGNELNLSAFFRAGKGLVELSIALSYATYPSVSEFLKTSLDMTTDVLDAAALSKEEKKSPMIVASFVYKFSKNVFDLGQVFSSAPEIKTISNALSIFSDITQAYKEYKNERYIEVFSNIGLIVIKSYRLISVNEETEKKEPKRILKFDGR